MAIDTHWGRTELRGIEIVGGFHSDLEGLAQLASGRSKLEPDLKLEHKFLLAMPISGTKEGSLPKAAERPLTVSPGYAAKRQPVVISPRVTDWGGKKWIPPEDLAKATGAKMGGCAFPNVCKIEIHDECDSCLLVTGHE